jgi:hypothetical protein
VTANGALRTLIVREKRDIIGDVALGSCDAADPRRSWKCA